MSISQIEGAKVRIALAMTALVVENDLWSDGNRVAGSQQGGSSTRFRQPLPFFVSSSVTEECFENNNELPVVQNQAFIVTSAASRLWCRP